MTDLGVVRSVDVAPVSLVSELDLVGSCWWSDLENKLITPSSPSSPLYYYLWRLTSSLCEILGVDGLVTPISFIHPVISVVVLGVLKLSVGLRIANLHVESFPGTVVLQLADLFVWHPGPLAHHLLQAGAVQDSVRQQLRQAGLAEESLLHVVVTVHPQGQLLDVGQTVGRDQGRDPGVIECHAARDHLLD